MEDEIFYKITRNVRRPAKHKKAIFTCGASGTGKTTNRSQFLKDAGLKTTHVYLNVDRLRYLAGSHEKGQVLLKHLVRRSIDEKYSILFDATCRDRKHIIELMKILKAEGYLIILAMTYAHLDTVIERAAKRVTQSIDEEIVRDIYQHMKKNAETYMNIDEIDEVYLYNNEETSTLIFHKNKKRIQCLSPDSEFYFDVSKYC
jgi:predicted ABC-type ATPase